MAIFLTILKIIGIVLLCIIGLIILILLYVLLAPFWFKIEGIVDRDLNYRVKVKATTFLHFIQVHVNLAKDEDLSFDATVLGPLVKVFPKDKKEDEADDDIKELEDKSASESESSEDMENVKSTAESDASDENTQTKAIKASSDDNTQAELIEVKTEENEAENESEIETESEKSEEEKTGFLDKIKAFFNKLNPKNWVEKLKQKINDTKEKIKGLKNKGNEILAILKDPANKAWLKKIFTQLKKLIKSFGINMRGTNLDFSLGSPDTTGKVSGALALFPPVYDKKVRILPDFSDEELYFDGNVFIKGRIQLVCMLYFVVVILLDKNTKKIIGLLK
ncbi:MAG: hypothetical protein K5644_04135 [Lachnospiraceae bacterium]|nr:hypothetical protein [Lachnospiraceae bacterium]